MTGLPRDTVGTNVTREDDTREGRANREGHRVSGLVALDTGKSPTAEQCVRHPAAVEEVLSLTHRESVGVT